MNQALAAEVHTLVDMGWTLRSGTDTTAALQTRGPFNWFLFALSMLFFLGVGGLIYLTFWLTTDRADVFLRVADDRVRIAGDDLLVERQKAEEERTRRLVLDVKERGFWLAAWPSVLAAVVNIGLWFLLIWAFVTIVR